MRRWETPLTVCGVFTLLSLKLNGMLYNEKTFIEQMSSHLGIAVS